MKDLNATLVASIPDLPTHYTLAIYEGDAPITEALMITSTNPRIVHDAASACQRHRAATERAREARRAAQEARSVSESRRAGSWRWSV